MNREITDGIRFMPSSFAQGLDRWSGSDHAGERDALPVAGRAVDDTDLGLCLEVRCNGQTQHLRYRGETPLLPGCYLRISAKVKVVSGEGASLRIAGWAGQMGRSKVPRSLPSGPNRHLMRGTEVAAVSAIVAKADRIGVDMVWSAADYGYFGFDIKGMDGTRLRISDVVIEDVTGTFARDLIGRVDVRDFGALGDGASDDSAAFLAADAAAEGAVVFVPRGLFHLAKDVTMRSKLAFQGQISQPSDRLFIMTQHLNLPMYLDAFAVPQIALEKGLAAYQESNCMTTFDLGGRIVPLVAPLVITGAGTLSNGGLAVGDQAGFAPQKVAALAKFSRDAPKSLTEIALIEDLRPGMRISGPGVGPDVYIATVHKRRGTLETTAPLQTFDGQQTYQFTRRPPLVDISQCKGDGPVVFDRVRFEGAGVCAGAFPGQMVLRNCDMRCAAVGVFASAADVHLRDCDTWAAKRRAVLGGGRL